MLRKALVVGCLLLGLAAPAALGASTTQILRDCADDGVLQGTYTPSELRKARQHIPADTDQYTDCRDVIARAAARSVRDRDRGDSGGAGGAGGGGSGKSRSDSGAPIIPSNDADQKDLDDAYKRGFEPQRVGELDITPGSAGLSATAARHDLPTSLIVVLALLGVTALAALLSRLPRDLLSRGRALLPDVGRGRS
jgi:hypothetical protein